MLVKADSLLISKEASAVTDQFTNFILNTC